MNKENCLRAVNQLMEDRRTNGTIEANRRREEIYAKIPEIREKDRLLKEHHASFFRFLTERDGTEEVFLQYRDRSLALQREIRELLVEHGYAQDYLDPVHVCPICSDEGVVDGKLCACYKQALSEQYLKESGMDRLFSGCGLSNYDLSLYSDECEGDGMSPRAKMKKIVDFAKKYVKSFGPDAQNLIFVGEPGCGKTFLSVCIGCEVIRSGKFVLYAPVQNLIADAEAETFRKGNGGLTTEDYLDADLLILDDLGTEFYSSFVESTLYSVINTRLARKKPTIISTNLTIGQREECYAARLNSRLAYSFLNLGFPEADLRAETLRRRSARRKKN